MSFQMIRVISSPSSSTTGFVTLICAMANFGLTRLRLVKPRDGWPNPRARAAASGADDILAAAALYDTLEAAVGDCSFVLAATARAHDQAKPVVDAGEAARLIAPRL